MTKKGRLIKHGILYLPNTYPTHISTANKPGARRVSFVGSYLLHVGPGDADDRRELDLDGHVPPGAVADPVGGHAVVHAAVLLLDVVDHQHVTAAGEDRGPGQVTTGKWRVIKGEFNG